MHGVRKKVIEHYQVLARRDPKYTPVRMAELAPGIIAVEDASLECDAIFDAAQWKFRHPELWEGDPENESPVLKSKGLRALEGVGRLPRVSTIEEMESFAKHHLTAKESLAWHDKPEFFEF